MDPLENRTRRKIVEALLDGGLTWKELAGKVGLATGGLYHHLDMLEGIVEKSGKVYQLTPEGKAKYDEIKSKEPVEGGAGVYSPEIRHVIMKLTETRLRTLASVFVVGAATLYFLVLGGNGVVFFATAPSLLPVVVDSYFATAVTLFLILYLSVFILFGIGAEKSQLLFGVLLSLMIPALFGAAYQSIPIAFRIFIDLLAALILASGVSVSTGIRIEKSIVIGLIPFYVSIVLQAVA